MNIENRLRKLEEKVGTRDPSLEDFLSGRVTDDMIDPNARPGDGTFSGFMKRLKQKTQEESTVSDGDDPSL